MDQDFPDGSIEPHRYLVAPWRLRYLTRGPETTSCIFCDKANSSDGEADLVLWRGETVFIMMNLFPYTTGHLMIVPTAHVPSPEAADPETMATIGRLVGPTMRALRRVLGCHGFNTGMNTGASAGAGIADHLHMHVVPRWGGDANFMPIIGDVTVMPEALPDTYRRLRPELEAELATRGFPVRRRPDDQ